MKGYAFLIGADVLNPDHYGKGNDLCSSLTDTQKIKTLLEETTLFEDRIIMKNNIDTHWDKLKIEFENFQNEVNNESQGSFVFLYFSGHGASIQITGEEKPKHFLCFYNKLIFEDQIKKRIAAFNKNCSVFIVIDSCYGEGIGPNAIEIPFLKSKVKRRRTKSLTSGFSRIFNDKRFHQDYMNTLLRYKTYKFETESDQLYFYACGENEVTFTGDFCSDQSDFSRFFVEYLLALVSQKTYNYFSLAKYLKESSYPTAIIKPESKHKPDSIFNNTFPLFFNLKTNSMLPDLIDLDETGKSSNNVMFKLKNNTFSYKSYYSITWLLDPSNDLHTYWSQLIEAKAPGVIDDTVKYLSFVFLEMKTPSNLPQPIRALFPKPPECSDCGFGVVVSVDDNMNMIHKPKRTTGKVSNKQGG